jgi:sporadic carbohydrate cluster protein (TIGR04323 family)
MKIFKGYISSRRLADGSYVPQKLQSIMIRNTCERFNIKFVFHATELIFENWYTMFHDLVEGNFKGIDGIALYSVFQLSDNKIQRNKLLKNVFQKKKELIMCNEKIYIKSESDLDLIDNYININKTLKYCPNRRVLLDNFK